MTKSVLAYLYVFLIINCVNKYISTYAAALRGDRGRSVKKRIYKGGINLPVLSLDEKSTVLSTKLTSVTSIETLGTNSNDKDVRFLVIGDWGKGGITGYEWSSKSDRNHDDDGMNIYGASDSSDKGNERQPTNQASIAAAMGSYADTFAPSFIVAAGDNFYTLGVNSTTDSNWNDLWANVYLTYASLRVSWHPVFGNHDYGYGESGIKAQIAMTDSSKYWSFPDCCYTKTFSFQGGQVGIVFLDTTTLAPDVNSMTSSVSNKEEIRYNQLVQIDSMLSKLSAVSWLLVVGHYPIYTGGKHGNTDDLVNDLLPLLLKYKVHAYFCGHDHSSEHLMTKDNSGHELHFFITGTGAMLDSYGNGNDLSRWHMTDKNAFVSVTAEQSSLIVSYITVNGNDPIYSVTMNNTQQTISYKPVFVGVGVVIGITGLALLFAFAPKSYRKKIRDALRLDPTICTIGQEDTMITTDSCQYFNTTSPNTSDSFCMTVKPENFFPFNSKDNKVHDSPDASDSICMIVKPENFFPFNSKDNKVHDMTTNVVIKKKGKKMHAKYDAVYVKGKLVEKKGSKIIKSFAI